MNWALTIIAAMPTFAGRGRLLMLLPLALAISVVHKTLKQERLADLPLAIAALWVTIVLGMLAVGVGLMLIYEVTA